MPVINDTFKFNIINKYDTNKLIMNLNKSAAIGPDGCNNNIRLNSARI